MTTATIKGTEYTIHTDDIRTGAFVDMVRITGKRGADGAVVIHKNGRAIVVGISTLERLNWFDITSALAGVVPGVGVA